MATDITETPNAGAETEQAAPSTEASASETAQPAKPMSADSAVKPLPPRVDGGENVEEVLGEVSKLFGQMGNGAAPPGRSAEDDINEDLNDLTAAGAPVAKAPAPAEPSPEMKLGTAADLFRSTPAETADASVNAGHPPGAASAPPCETAETQARRPAGPARLPTSRAAVSIKRLQTLWIRLPARARLPIAMAMTLAMGLIAGTSLTRSRAHETAPVVTTPEKPAENVSGQSGEAAAKAAALEEQLQQALAERAAAQRERQQAVVQLKLLEAQSQTGKQSTHAAIEQEQAARRRAEAGFHVAEEQIRLLELRTYDVQLARVRETWRQNPGLALALLDDAARCPARLRDFTWGYFHGRARNDRATLAGHSGRINAVAWSPDGKQIVSGGQDGFAKFWDAGSGKEIASLVAHGGGVSALAFSTRGELIATAGADGTIKLWDFASRKVVATFFGHLGAVRAVAIAPDVSALASAGDDGTVRFWDVASRRATATRWGRPRSREPAADDPLQSVRSIAYSPDGLLVASGGYKVVRIWDGVSAAEKTMLSVADGFVAALAFSPKGSTLAGGTDGEIYRWDVDSFVPRSTPVTVDGRVNGLRYSSDGRMLAAATDQGALLFREPADRPRDEPLRLLGHVGKVTGVALSPNGETVVTSGEDGTLRLWNPRNGEIDKVEPDVIFRCRRPAVAVAYSPDGKRFAAAGSDAITLWNVSDGVETATLKNRSGEMTQIAFSPDGTRLASASKDWPILIWDLAGQRVVAALNGHTGGVNSISFSVDGKHLISGSDDGTVRVWEMTAARELAALSGHAAAVLCVAISQDGKVAASAGADHSVRLWDVVQKRPLATLAGHQAPVVSIAFSPDGRFLASAESAAANAAPATDAKHRPIRVWRLPKCEEAHEFGSPGFSVRAVIFSPDGKTLATSDRDGVTLWDAATCEFRETLRFSDAGLFSPLAFSPSGLTLAAGGQSAIVFWTAADFGKK